MYNDPNFMYKLRVGRVEAGQVAPRPTQKKGPSSRKWVKTLMLVKIKLLRNTFTANSKRDFVAPGDQVFSFPVHFTFD